jgi:hypothetical protein
MKKIIRSLRNKPDHVKTRYVVVFALIATIIVLGTWVVVTQSIKQQDQTISAESPFSIFRDIIGAAVSEIGKSSSIANPTETDDLESPELPQSENQASVPDQTFSDQQYQSTQSDTPENPDGVMGIPRSVVQ